MSKTSNNPADLVNALRTMTEQPDSHQRMVYIPIGDLLPHPDNPRQDLGDLSELTDSIIANGVMQNLTVVPCIKDSNTYDRMLDGRDDGAIRYSEAYRQHAITHAFTNKYTVVIGHRRLAASDLAGLKELPCVIVDMDYPTQIATMMTENLQRRDLTVYEQAQGFKQLSINFGMSAERIAEKTGFSATTVRRRLKLCDLNQDTLKEVSGRQINMTDFERLDKIDDPKLRDEALKEIGTFNFNNKCYVAEQEIKKKKKREAWQKICKEAGLIEVSENTGNKRDKYDYVAGLYGDTPSREQIEKYITDGRTLYFYIDRWGYAYIVSRKDDENSITPEQLKKQEEEQKREATCAALAEALERAFKLRYDFIDSFTETTAKKHVPEIMRFAARVNVCYGGDFDSELFWKLMGGTEERWEELEDAEWDEVYASVKDSVTDAPHFAALAMAYAGFCDTPNNHCYDYWGNYVKSPQLSDLYEHLCELGYEMSDEERELMDGTSALYHRNEAEEPAQEEPDEETPEDAIEETVAEEIAEEIDDEDEPKTRFDVFSQMSPETIMEKFGCNRTNAVCMVNTETPQAMADSIYNWFCPPGKNCEHNVDGGCVGCIEAWLKEPYQEGELNG